MNSSISVIICTRNRAESLRQTLAALAVCQMPPGLSAELLVVDNGSTDRTPDVVQACRLSNFQIRYVLEQNPGQCQARNRGLAESDGTVILFTDDDIRPPADWIESMCRPILNNQSDAVTGGVIFPPRHKAILQTLPFRPYRGWFATTEGIDPDHPQRLVGANMSFGKHVLRDVPSFDVNLGPGALGFGDETLFSAQLLDHGYRITSAFASPVEHHFDLSRLNRRSLFDIARRMGESEAYLSWHWRHEDHDCTETKLRRLESGLTRRRFLSPSHLARTGQAVACEINRTREIAFAQKYMIERQKPRRYSRAEKSPLAPATA